MRKAIGAAAAVLIVNCLASVAVLAWRPVGTIAANRRLFVVSTAAVALAALFVYWRDQDRTRFWNVSWLAACLVAAACLFGFLQAAPRVIAERIANEIELTAMTALAHEASQFPSQPTWRECWRLELSVWAAERECAATAAAMAGAGTQHQGDLAALEARIAAGLPPPLTLKPLDWSGIEPTQAREISRRLDIAFVALAEAAAKTRLKRLVADVERLAAHFHRPELTEQSGDIGPTKK